MGCQLRERVLFIGTPSVTLALGALLLVTSAEVTKQVPKNTNSYPYLSCSSNPDTWRTLADTRAQVPESCTGCIAKVAMVRRVTCFPLFLPAPLTSLFSAHAVASL